MPSRLSPAGGMRSNAEDVAVFARALCAGELFDDEAALDAMLEPGTDPRYGLGVQLRPDGTQSRSP